MSLNTNDKEKAPLFKTWNGWYWLVILCLAASIVLFYLLTKRFA